MGARYQNITCALLQEIDDLESDIQFRLKRDFSQVDPDDIERDWQMLGAALDRVESIRKKSTGKKKVLQKLGELENAILAQRLRIKRHLLVLKETNLFCTLCLGPDHSYNACKMIDRETAIQILTSKALCQRCSLHLFCPTENPCRVRCQTNASRIIPDTLWVQVHKVATNDYVTIPETNQVTEQSKDLDVVPLKRPRKKRSGKGIKQKQKDKLRDLPIAPAPDPANFVVVSFKEEPSTSSSSTDIQVVKPKGRKRTGGKKGESRNGPTKKPKVAKDAPEVITEEPSKESKVTTEPAPP